MNTNKPEIYINENLKTLRNYYSMRQKEVAAHLGVQRATYDAWENKGVEPKLQYIVELSKLYKISLEFFLSVRLTNEKINYLLKTLSELK